MAKPAALELIKLTKSYGGTVAVDAIDQVIPDGPAPPRPYLLPLHPPHPSHPCTYPPYIF